MKIFPRIEVHAADHCTLSCVGCNHASPHLKKRSYSVEEYTPWLDLIRKHNFDWEILGISGGEPFIIQEKLNDFCYSLKRKYHSRIELFTNAFWLTSLDSIDKYSRVFQNIESLQISWYKPYVEKLGWETCQKFMDEIRKRFRIHVFSFQTNGVKAFGQVYFYDTPVHVDSSSRCVVKDCTQLTAEGILYRCTYGHFLKTDIPSDGFKHSQDIVFDLRDIGKRDLRQWRSKWPLDSCRYCGCGPDRIIHTAWRSDSKIKDMSRKEYLEYLQEMVPAKLNNLEPKRRINLL